MRPREGSDSLKITQQVRSQGRAGARPGSPVSQPLFCLFVFLMLLSMKYSWGSTVTILSPSFWNMHRHSGSGGERGLDSGPEPPRTQLMGRIIIAATTVLTLCGCFTELVPSVPHKGPRNECHRSRFPEPDTEAQKRRIITSFAKSPSMTWQC